MEAGAPTARQLVGVPLLCERAGAGVRRDVRRHLRATRRAHRDPRARWHDLGDRALRAPSRRRGGDRPIRSRGQPGGHRLPRPSHDGRLGPRAPDAFNPPRPRPYKRSASLSSTCATASTIPRDLGSMDPEFYGSDWIVRRHPASRPARGGSRRFAGTDSGLRDRWSIQIGCALTRSASLGKRGCWRVAFGLSSRARSGAHAAVEGHPVHPVSRTPRPRGRREQSSPG